jgi:NAD(P)-dependent dehydrogenase (short-subunit alcohol dehydrogenase family)
MTKVAIITGAGTGIGAASSRALARAGYAVALAGRRSGPLEEVRDQCGRDARVIVVPTDIGDPGSVKTLFQQTHAAFGRLDLLFNNAGAGSDPVAFEDISFDDWRRVLDVNLTGAFLCSQEAFRQMREQDPQGGRIINNGSISAHVPRPLSAPYTATKHAMTGLTRSTSLDGRAYNIAVGQIDIGNAATMMTERMTDGVLQADGSTQPEPRMDVEKVADAVVHMAALPLDANIQFMTIMATRMPYIGRG